MFLVVDSSLATSVAVVSSEGEILSERSSTDARGHAENIGALMQEALDASGVTPAELTGVVMGVGPGPFTGLRVGMAAAEAFALSRSLPLVPIISHDAPAHGAGDCVVITDARRGEIAFSVYAGEGVFRRVQGPALCRPENLDAELGGYESLPRIQAETISAGALGQVAATYLESGVPLASPAPQYLRAPDVTVMPRLSSSLALNSRIYPRGLSWRPHCLPLTRGHRSLWSRRCPTPRATTSWRSPTGRTLWWAMRGFAPLASTPSRVIFRPLRSLPFIVAEAWVERYCVPCWLRPTSGEPETCSWRSERTTREPWRYMSLRVSSLLIVGWGITNPTGWMP